MEAEKMETERIDVIESERNGTRVYEARIVVEFESENDAEGFADAFMARGIIGLMDYDINLQVH
jgi:hypothetical protein|tara:strand:- start:436 stop:627 length:192 start_codon:yes stop_codon:yes gene_type:complete